MQVNLRQARRLERDLMNAQTNLQSQVNGHNIRVTIHQNFNEAVSKVQDKVTSTVESIAKLVELRFAVRKAIETKNETAGLNALMNEEARLKEQVKVLLASTSSTFTADEEKVAAARHAAMVNSGPTTTNYGNTIDYIDLGGNVSDTHAETVRKVVVKAQRRIAKIAEELGYLNTSTLIELDSNAVQLLELHDIAV